MTRPFTTSIHAKKDVDARDERGHDGGGSFAVTSQIAIVEYAETLPRQRHAVKDYFPFLRVCFPHSNSQTCDWQFAQAKRTRLSRRFSSLSRLCFAVSRLKALNLKVLESANDLR
jgi:hypothetical protein